MKTLFVAVVFASMVSTAMANGGVFNEHTYIQHVIDTYGKKDIVAYITSKREGKITIETDDYMYDYSGKPGSEYVNVSTIKKDLDKMGQDVLAFKDGVKAAAKEEKLYVKIDGNYFRVRNKEVSIKIRSGGGPGPVDASNIKGPGRVPTFKGSSAEAEAYIERILPGVESLISRMKASYTRMNGQSMSSKYSGELAYKNMFDEYNQKIRLLNARLGVCDDLTLIKKVQSLRSDYSKLSMYMNYYTAARTKYLVEKKNPGASGRDLTVLQCREVDRGYPTIGQPYSSAWY